MAEITRKRQGELLRKVFEILWDQADGMPAREVLSRLESEMELTPFELSTYPKQPDVQRFTKIVRFTTIGPVKAGWMVKEKGNWRLTDQGRAAYEQFEDPEDLFRRSIELYKKWEAEQPAKDEIHEEDEGETPGAAVTLEAAEESAWSEIETYVRDMDPFDYQELVAALLRAMGYRVTWIAPPGPDGGMDLVAQSDPLGAKGPRIKGQVKRKQAKTTVEEVRSFLALVGDQDVGLFISMGGFTGDALNLVRTQEKRRVTLITLSDLFDLWVEHYPRVDEEHQQLLPVKPVYYLAPRK